MTGFSQPVTGHHSLVIGGADLVAEFADRVRRADARRIWLVVPYVDHTGASWLPWLLAATHGRAVEVSVVVRSHRCALEVQREVRRSPRWQIYINRRVHAKCFVMAAADRVVALVTSANLTAASLLRNVEVAVLLDLRRTTAQGSPLRAFEPFLDSALAGAERLPADGGSGRPTGGGQRIGSPEPRCKHAESLLQDALPAWRASCLTRFQETR